MSIKEKLDDIVNELIIDKEPKYQKLYLTKREIEEVNEWLGVPKDEGLRNLCYAGFDFDVYPNPKPRNTEIYDTIRKSKRTNR